jgi:hypothetical protein
LPQINILKKAFQVFFLILILAQSLVAQRYIDVAVAAKKEVAVAFSYDKFWGNRFKLGLGLRSNIYQTGPKDYITAPALLTSGRRSIAAFFTSYKNEKLDTLQLESVLIANLNTKLSLEYRLKKELSIGFNIDLLGFTVGKKSEGIFIASENKQFHKRRFNAKPSPYNFMLISDSDRGSLNSELYLRKNINEKNLLRFGASFQFIEYKTSQELSFDNDRFRRKTLMPFISYSILLK